ncbi:MAG: hypothetical protein AB1726_18035 [Planctomycetota bacterium]
MSGGPGSIPADVVRARIDEILAGERAGAGPTVLERFGEWMSETFALPAVSEEALRLLLWILAGLVLVLAVLLAARLVAPARRAARGDRGGEREPGPAAKARARALRREARQARAAGDLRTALRLSLFALVVGLGDRGDLAYRDAWTYRELLARGAPSGPARALLAPLVAELEAKGYGRVPATAADVDRLEALCTAHLGPLGEEEG